MRKVIDSFQGEYRFLSNFYMAPITINGLRFTSSEAAYQGHKCPERAAEFCDLDPSSAKRLGQQVELRPDWDRVKYSIMYNICSAKFVQNPDLLERLLATGDAELIEGNTWGDTVWGVCNGVGHNQLGKILMRLREMFRGRTEDMSGVCGMHFSKYLWDTHISKTMTQEDFDKWLHENCYRCRYMNDVCMKEQHQREDD